MTGTGSGSNFTTVTAPGFVGPAAMRPRLPSSSTRAVKASSEPGFPGWPGCGLASSVPLATLDFDRHWLAGIADFQSHRRVGVLGRIRRRGLVALRLLVFHLRRGVQRGLFLLLGLLLLRWRLLGLLLRGLLGVRFRLRGL